MNDIPVVENLLHLNIFLYERDIVDAKIVGELAQRSVQKYGKTIRLLRYNNHICYVSNINAVMRSFRCPNFDTFSIRTSSLERHLASCSERVKPVYPKKVYQIRETLFDKLNSYRIEYPKEQALLNNLILFDFESICAKEDSFKDTDTTKWIGYHISTSVSISSNLVEQPFFLRNADPQYLVASFRAALENLASHSRIQKKTLFFDIETAIKTRLDRNLESLSQRHNRRGQVIEAEDVCFQEDSADSWASIQFFQMQKNQLIDLQVHLERYCNVLPVFGFNSAKHDITLIKSYLPPILINGWDIEPVFNKEANQYSSFMFDDIQLLDIMVFLGGAPSFD